MNRDLFPTHLGESVTFCLGGEDAVHLPEESEVVLLQIAPVVDASSAQSRADVLAIGLSAVVLLIGLQWISLTPRTPVKACSTKLGHPHRIAYECSAIERHCVASPFKEWSALICLQVYDTASRDWAAMSRQTSHLHLAYPPAGRTTRRHSILHQHSIATGCTGRAQMVRCASPATWLLRWPILTGQGFGSA